ncbi:hypothetical protein BDW74DRAFT_178147 [Aspergillus multicolor]|uniref:uncharacterized protein n=1 Tax=Aspergillus multicolor TaxID=41759 RepID=UPI003CCE24B8
MAMHRLAFAKSLRTPKPRFEFERRLLRASNNPLPDSELATPADPEDYILYMGRPWPPLPTQEAEFVAILRGTKSKICRWNYTILHSDGKGGERWVHVENYHTSEHYRCDERTIKYKILVIKAKDLEKYDRIVARYRADCSTMLCHAVLFDCLEHRLIEVPKGLALAQALGWSLLKSDIRKLRLPKVP